LFREWAGIVALLECEIEGVAAILKTPEPGASALEIKACEDALDAVVCAWVAVCALEGRAVAFGDDSGAIWIPSAGVTMCAGHSSRGGAATDISKRHE
jgi:predicted RNase H-like nuclease